MKHRHVLLFSLLLALTFGLASCAAGPNELAGTIDGSGVLAGFWRGLWHGLISPITFVISLFSDHVAMYEVHNNGGWYNLGFILGAMTTFGGCGNRTCAASGTEKAGAVTSTTKDT